MRNFQEVEYDTCQRKIAVKNGLEIAPKPHAHTDFFGTNSNRSVIIARPSSRKILLVFWNRHERNDDLQKLSDGNLLKRSGKLCA